LLTDLVGYWKLDEASGTRLDSVGTNDAAVVGSPGSAAGILSNAVDTSLGNYLDAGTVADLQTGDIDFTFALWLWFDQVATPHDLFGKWAGGELEYFLYYNETAHVLHFFVSDDGLNYNSVAGASLNPIAVNTWYFVVCWHDAIANTLNIQINDGPVDSVSYSIGVRAGIASLLFGQSGFGGSHDGLIDEAGLWKRLLTAPERTDLYNAGVGRTHPFA
jgi:hypothetical protein